MNPRETANIGLLAALSSLVLCQFVIRVGGHPVQLSSAQIAHGLAMGLGGVVIGLLLVLGASALQAVGSAWVRSFGPFGLALGGALLLALFVSHRPMHTRSTLPATHAPVAADTVLLAPGAWR